MKGSRSIAVLAALAAVLASLVVAAPASAQGPSLMDVKTSTADVTLTTTTEKEVIVSNLTNTPRDEALVVVLCWAQLTTGTNTTSVVPMIRRGSGITGTAITESNIQTIVAAAGSTEEFFWMGIEQRAATNLQYSCTLKQAGASADGTALQAGIAVFAR